MTKKTKPIKLPKKVVGIKLSKSTRKTVGSVIGLLDTPQAKTLIGSGVAALAALVASRESKPAKPAKRAKPAPRAKSSKTAKPAALAKK